MATLAVFSVAFSSETYIKIHKRRGRELVLHRQTTHAAHDVIHGVLNLVKPPYTTPLTLDVLAQSTKSREFGAAGTERAKISLRLMARTSEVLVQRRESAEPRVTEITLVAGSVPRRGCRIVGDFVTRSGGEETRGVRDDVRPVVFANVAVDNTSVDPRAATSRFEVKNHGGAGNECQDTSLKRTADVLWTMDRRVEMLTRASGSNRLSDILVWYKTHRIKVASRQEDPLALDAVVMRLSVVFMQTKVVLENLAAWLAE
jgi:hypothetical protein